MRARGGAAVGVPAARKVGQGFPWPLRKPQVAAGGSPVRPESALAAEDTSVPLHGNIVR
jgi:hypothetical protein